MRISYYAFPKEMTIREIALITKREIEGKENIVSVPDGISDEQLEENFSRTIDCSVSTTKRVNYPHLTPSAFEVGACKSSS